MDEPAQDNSAGLIPADSLADFFGFAGDFGRLVPTAADLHLLVDPSFRVATVLSQPESCDAQGRSLLYLVDVSVRQQLREAVERCVNAKTSERLSIRLIGDQSTELTAVLTPFEHVDGTYLALTAIENQMASAAISQAESQLAMLRRILDLMDVAVFWKDLDSRFLGANQKLITMLGASNLSEVLGKDDFAFFPEEDAQAYQQADREVMETGNAIIDHVETLTAADGTVETLVTTKMPVRDGLGEVVGMIGYFQVVTDALNTEQELRSLESRYTLALDVGRDGVWEFNYLTRELEVTPRFAELVGLDRSYGQKLKFQDLASLVNDDAMHLLSDTAEGVRADPDRHMALVQSVVMQDGSTRWLEVVGYPFVEQGTVTRLIGSVADISDKVERERDLLYRATHDYLTGLANRRALLDRIDTLLAAGTAICLLYLDLDQFKVVNDSLGHQVGDELLEAVSDRLSGLVDEDHLLARLGGDEFAIVGTKGSCALERLGEDILEALEAPLALGEFEIYTTCSVGVVHADRDYDSALDILRDGDIALYRAKADGKSCVRVFEESMRDEAEGQHELQNRIRHAVVKDEFVLHYQPVVELHTGAISGIEALLRWDSSDGLLLPNTFLPYLEQCGLIVDVGEWVLREAVAQLAQWNRDIPTADPLVMSVNLSRVQFRSPDLVEIILGCLEEHEVDAGQLIVEITETAISDNFESMVETLETLRKHGVRVAIDDFGVGQSSLSSLFQLPADILKIDRAFLARVEDEAAESVLIAVLEMARAVGLRTTAEGVETEVQRAFLRGAGCDFMQGHLVGKSMAPDELAKLLQ